MNSNKTIIFCQAPADIPYVLTIYEQQKGKSEVSIFVINVEGLFRFLTELNLELEQLIFIPYKLKNIKQIGSLYTERNRINTIWQNHFSKIKEGKVYFFSRFEDWLTAAFIHRFTKQENIQIGYTDHYDSSADLFKKNLNITLKNRIYLLILKYLTGVDFKILIREKLPEFPVEKYSIQKVKAEVNNQLYSKYAFKSAVLDGNALNLLLFVSPCDNTIFNPKFYNNRLIEIINILKVNGFRITVKGHPRIGLPMQVKEVADYEIPSYVPGEFIDTNKFSICIGLDTTAICNFARNNILPTYSAIKLFPSVKKEMIDSLIKYLRQQSNNKMLFFDNLEDLKKIALTHF